MYKYTITSYLLKLIKDISLIASRLDQFKLHKPVLFELEQEALSQSSYSSTSIEGNPLPLTEVRKILKQSPKNIRKTEREVLQYNNALIWLNEKVKNKKFELGSQSIIQIHAKLMKKLLPEIKLNQFRKEPVLVNDPKLRRPVFWPPDHQDVKQLMGDLIQFVHSARKEMEPLIIAGIFHKQFALIHPFIDGNGRTVRLITKALLADLGLNTFTLFSFETFYSQNVSRYFKMVGEKGDYYDIYKSVNFTPWLEYFCEGVLDELLRVEKNLENRMKSLAASGPDQELLPDQQKILKYLKKHEYITDRHYSKLTSRAKATRALDFKKMIDLGYLVKAGAGPSTHYKLKK